VLRQPSIQAQISEKIDMIHIDGNHSEMTSLEDVKRWVPQVKSGGVVVFDDVNLNTTNKAVEWLDKNCIRFQEFEGDNIWAIWIKP
jgi:predicted O-methyltransferase YrrM